MTLLLLLVIFLLRSLLFRLIPDNPRSQESQKEVSDRGLHTSGELAPAPLETLSIASLPSSWDPV